MFFCGLPQFYADRVDDDIEGPFMFLFDLLMNEPAYGISSSFYFQFYGGDGRIGNIADQVIIVDSLQGDFFRYVYVTYLAGFRNE